MRKITISKIRYSWQTYISLFWKYKDWPSFSISPRKHENYGVHSGSGLVWHRDEIKDHLDWVTSQYLNLYESRQKWLKTGTLLDGERAAGHGHWRRLINVSIKTWDFFQPQWMGVFSVSLAGVRKTRMKWKGANAGSLNLFQSYNILPLLEKI